MNNRMNSSLSSNHPAWCKIASAPRNWINSVAKTVATTFAFSIVFVLLLWRRISKRKRQNVVWAAWLFSSWRSPQNTYCHITYRILIQQRKGLHANWVNFVWPYSLHPIYIIQGRTMYTQWQVPKCADDILPLPHRYSYSICCWYIRYSQVNNLNV